MICVWSLAVPKAFFLEEDCMRPYVFFGYVLILVLLVECNSTPHPASTS